MIGKKGTLTRQLVTRIAVLVAAVAVALSVLITAIATHILNEQLDRQVDAALSIQFQSGRGGGPTGGQRPGSGPGLPPGTIILQQADSGSTSAGTVTVYAWRIVRGGWEQVSSDVAQQMFAVQAGRQRVTLQLGSLGKYRVAAMDRDGMRTVVALPTDDLDSTTNALIIAELTLGIGAVIASIFISGALVRRTVRPLNRLADAAREVSQLELHTGEVNLPVRLDTSGLHPNNEMAQVGSAFNHMLNNVEGALSARQASETKVRQFVADASHELRNPLASIRGYSELTRRQAADLPADTGFALERIDAESQRMSKLVNDLLLLARLDDHQALETRPVDMTEVVLNAVSDARAASPAHVWTLRLPDEPAMVSGEADRLHQVVTNLLSNARTHTPSGTSVLTSVERDGDQVVVRVIDDGPGITPEQQALVFERFARGDAARTHSSAESTGLGLAIVSAVVTAHGGRVWLSSHPGRTEFSVALPALDAATTTLK